MVLDPQRLPCAKCPSIFRRCSDLAHHLVTQHGDTSDVGALYDAVYYAARPFRCVDCVLAYPKRYALTRHAQLEHGKALPWLNAPAFDAEYYEERPFRCARCPRAYASEHKHSEHVIMKHQQVDGHAVTPSGPQDHQCPDCDRSYRQRSQLNAHCRRTHKTTLPPREYNAAYYAVRPYRCAHCNVACRRYHMLRAHCARLHAVEIPRRRPKCPAGDADLDTSASTRAPSALSERSITPSARAPSSERSITVEKRETSTSDIGPEETKARSVSPVKEEATTTTPPPSEGALSPSMKSESAASVTELDPISPTPSAATPSASVDQYPFKCVNFYDWCTRMFTASQALSAHHRHDHADDVEYSAVYYASRSYRCDDCAYACTSSSSLQTHMRKTHKNYRCIVPRVDYDDAYYAERPFPCAHCPRAFTRGDTRYSHERSAHRDASGVKNVQTTKRPRKPKTSQTIVGDKRNTDAARRSTIVGKSSKQCAHCPRRYANRGFLDRHVALVHDARRRTTDG